MFPSRLGYGQTESACESGPQAPEDWIVPGGLDVLEQRRPLLSPYHPMPKPSPLVVAPIRECRLWSINECAGRKSTFSTSIGSPE